MSSNNTNNQELGQEQMDYESRFPESEIDENGVEIHFGSVYAYMKNILDGSDEDPITTVPAKVSER